MVKEIITPCADRQAHKQTNTVTDRQTTGREKARALVHTHTHTHTPPAHTISDIHHNTHAHAHTLGDTHTYTRINSAT